MSNKNNIIRARTISCLKSTLLFNCSFEVGDDPHNSFNSGIEGDYDFIPLIVVLLIVIIGFVVWILFKIRKGSQEND